MKYLSAYMLAVLGGNAAPSKADVKKVLESASIETDDEAIDRMLAAVADKVRS